MEYAASYLSLPEELGKIYRLRLKVFKGPSMGGKTLTCFTDSLDFNYLEDLLLIWGCDLSRVYTRTQAARAFKLCYIQSRPGPCTLFAHYEFTESDLAFMEMLVGKGPSQEDPACRKNE